MVVNTLQFEAVKIAMKQDKTGIILTLNIHPDDLPIDLMRDFVGARYQVVMVRLNDENKPMSRDAEYSRDPVRTAGILCRDKQFALYLHGGDLIFEANEADATDWLKDALDVQSRTELKEDQQKAKKFWAIYEDYQLWKRNG
jgi:hypothetical protein